MGGIVALVLVAAATAIASQQDIPRLRSGVDVVPFTVTVLDKDRHPITGLESADFEVLVDGKPRPLAAFAAVTLPADASRAIMAAPLVAPDVQTNQLPPEGRLIVIVMDRSTPTGQPMQAARAVATAAIDRLGPADLGAGVFTAAGLLKYSQGITADRARLHAAIAEALGGALQEPPLPPTLAAFVAARGAPQPSQPLNRVQLASEELSGECRCGICVPDALNALAKELSGPLIRHKSILFVGSDIAIASTDPPANAPRTSIRRENGCRGRWTRLMSRFTPSIRVDSKRWATRRSSAGPRDAESRRRAFFASPRSRCFPTTPAAVWCSTRTSQRTGSEIFDESRSYYVLAIVRDPAASGADMPHQITVAVKRNDATVHARNLYFAADPTAKKKPLPNAAAAALGELLPRADFPLQMNSVPQFSDDGSPEVRVLLSVASEVAGKLDVLIASFDKLFTPVGTSLKQRLDVPVAAVAASAAFQWTSVLKLPPRDYEIRAAVATEDGTRAASVVGFVEVPDVRKTGLALSGVIVKRAGSPTPQRAFAAGEPVGLAFQLARTNDASPNATVRFLLTDAAGQSLASLTVPPPTRVRNGIEDYDLTARLPGQSGQYVAAIETTDGRHTERRAVLLTVR